MDYKPLNMLKESYVIMNKDRRVALIRGNGTCTIYAPAFLPYGIWLETENQEELDVRLNNLENFYYWCACRMLTLDRKYAKEILNSIGQKQAVTDRDRAQIAILYHGVSLTDVYWIKGERESISYDEINLYQHSLSEAFVNVSLRGLQMTAQNASLIRPGDVAGNLSTSGVVPKAWIRRNGVFYLLKGGDAAVQAIGLHQVADISEEWIEDEQHRKMFFARLELLRENAE